MKKMMLGLAVVILLGLGVWFVSSEIGARNELIDMATYSAMMDHEDLDWESGSVTVKISDRTDEDVSYKIYVDGKQKYSCTANINYLKSRQE